MNMAKCTTEISKSVVSATVGVGALVNNSNSGRRVRLSGLIIGPDAATLGTSNRRFEIQRSTTTPTGTALSVQFLDSADVLNAGAPFGSLSANGTLTSGAILLTIGLSEQASFRWIAAPGEEIVIPYVAGANPGVHLMTPQAGNGQSVATQWFWDD